MYERKGSPYNSNMTSLGLEIQTKNEIQTHSVIFFSRNPNALKLVMNASFTGKKGPLIPLISGQKPQKVYKHRSSYSHSHQKSDDMFLMNIQSNTNANTSVAAVQRRVFITADLGFYKTTNMQQEFNLKIQEESTSCFYEDENVLKEFMDISSDGHHGPLIPLVREPKQVSAVISRPGKLKQRPSTSSSFHNWLKNTKIVCSRWNKKPQNVYKECSSYDTHPADNAERVFETRRIFEHGANVRKEVHAKEVHAGVYMGKK